MRRPRFIAEQARDASGLLGRLIAFIMARETWRENRRAIEALDIRDGDHVLDVGCGHGRSLAALAALTPKGRVVGADPSDLMAEIAIGRNRGLIRSGRVNVVVAAADELPFAAASFDKAMCVHVVYFWPQLAPALGEIARVLKPGGQLTLLFRTDADRAAAAAFPADVYRFPPLAETMSVLRGAGLAVDVSEEVLERQQSGPILLIASKVASG